MWRRLKTVVGDINRLRVILVVFFEEGYGFLIERVRLSYLLPIKSRVICFFKKCRPSRIKTAPVISLPERLRIAFERLGPTFIKFGQLLSLRSDLIPHEYAKALQKLQSNASFFAFEQIKQIIHEEFGKEIKDIFKKFEEKPFAAASLSQVHRARLKDNTEVAVKVQRPHIRSLIEKDIHILFFLAGLAEKYFREISYIQPVKIVKEFSEWTMRELDFTVEASNAERFRQNFAQDERFYIPKIYWEYTSKRILTMEFMHGTALDDISKIKALGDDPQVLALNGLEIGLRQLFVHGFFQADPHPGNFFVLPDNVLCLHDFGMVGYLDRQLRDKLVAAFISFVEKDIDFCTEKMLNLSPEPQQKAKEQFVQKALPILGFWFYSQAEKKSLAKVFYDLLVEGVKSGLYFPTNLILFSKAFVTVEGTVYSLYPDFDPSQELTPLIVKVIREKFEPQRFTKDIAVRLVEYFSFLQQLPEHTLKLMEKIEKGQVDIHIDKSEIMVIKETMDRENNIRLISIIIVALIVSSGIILRLEQQTFVFGFSVAKIELLLALILGIWLLVLIKRK